ncbi:hypothetical protein GARY_210 [Vibrio phage Gary]|uniref:Uncharacterized protein n=1 Tax=Vibrio phage Gary TaxID=2801534 RepID=A0A7U0G8C0_9CAUD|nr:hypothetical protein KNV71_gp002 [Vibrio phage Gary]YP_010114357.1 hypothetical protein KNV71_gp109 [Vibrio phage Gary]QQV88106.1 hypothetical protein GARY_2 [Vibrio phage Gary]QQV88291.1 hypothetical protein GARY_210 [Vibrio phage Gary]
MLRPSEMLVSFLQQVYEAHKQRGLYYKGVLVDEIEQVEYDKFTVRHTQHSDEEIRCDGITIREFLEIVRDFEPR